MPFLNATLNWRQTGSNRNNFHKFGYTRTHSLEIFHLVKRLGIWPSVLEFFTWVFSVFQIAGIGLKIICRQFS